MRRRDDDHQVAAHPYLSKNETAPPRFPSVRLGVYKSLYRSLNRDHIQAALGEVRDLSDGVGLDEPFTAFHRGSETGVSHDGVKFVRLVAFDSKGLRMEETWLHIALLPTL